MAKPISPAVAKAPVPNLYPAINGVNAALSIPWTDAERARGRTLTAMSVYDLGTAGIKALAKVYRDEGWVVTSVGDGLCFRPPEEE
jgi:hypothetical protein